MPTDHELNQFLALAKPDFLELYKKQRISPADIMDKEWIERFAVTVEMWQRCDFAARQALINDPNPSVRRAAMQKQKKSLVYLSAAAKESNRVSQTTV